MAEAGLGVGRTSFVLDRVEVEEAPGAFRTLCSGGSWQTSELLPGRPLPDSPLPGGGRSPLGSFLRVAEVIHLGKGAVFGLGHIALG